MVNCPKITMVTPSFNQGEYLGEAIESVIKQNYPNLEYFVMDGGSTDNSVEVIRKYEDKINYWISEKDNGQSDAINKAFSRSSGEILGWINSDDALFPGILNNVGAYFEQNPDIDVVTCGYAYVNEHGVIKGCYFPPYPNIWLAKRGAIMIGQQATFFRKAAYNRVNGVRDDFIYRMDTELWLKMLLDGAEFSVIRKMGGFFRWHGNMKSINYEGRKAEELECLKEEYNYGVSGLQEFIALIAQRIFRLLGGSYYCSVIETLRLRGKSIADIWNKQG